MRIPEPITLLKAGSPIAGTLLKCLLSLVITLFTCACGDGREISPAGKRVMILGDSITNAGTYVSFIDYYLQKHNPDKEYDIISVGLASETVSGLSEKDHPFPRPCVHERLGRALEKIEPDIVAACYGMNDGIYHPQGPDRMAAFREGTLKLVDRCRAAGVDRVILLTPPPFDPQPVRQKLYGEGETNYSYKHPYRGYAGVLEDYAAWIMGLKCDGVVAIDINTPMTAFLEKKRKTDTDFRFSGDGIHPSPLGHLLMARVFLEGIGAAIAFDGLAEELKTVRADPLFTLIDKRRRLRSKGWLQYIGYTRGKTVKKDAIDETRAAAAALQRRIDELRRRG